MTTTTCIEFFAQGLPKAQPRQRAFARNGMVRMYDPGTAEAWKAAIAAALREHMPAAPLDGPLRIVVWHYLPRPKAHYLRGELRGNAPLWHTSKPDSDNLLKAAMDALTTMRVWRDDAQVASVSCRKLYANGDTGAQFKIEALKQEGE